MLSLHHARNTVIQVGVVVALVWASVACSTSSEPAAVTPTPAPATSAPAPASQDAEPDTAEPDTAEPDTAEEPVGDDQQRAVDNLMQFNAALWDVEVNRACIAETVAGLAPSDVALVASMDPTDLEADLGVSREADGLLVSALFNDCPEIDSYRAESVKNVAVQPDVDVDCVTERLASLMTVEEIDEFVTAQVFDICSGA